MSVDHLVHIPSDPKNHRQLERPSGWELVGDRAIYVLHFVRAPTWLQFLTHGLEPSVIMRKLEMDCDT